MCLVDGDDERRVMVYMADILEFSHIMLYLHSPTLYDNSYSTPYSLGLYLNIILPTKISKKPQRLNVDPSGTAVGILIYLYSTYLCLVDGDDDRRVMLDMADILEFPHIMLYLHSHTLYDDSYSTPYSLGLYLNIILPTKISKKPQRLNVDPSGTAGGILIYLYSTYLTYFSNKNERLRPRAR